jgi:hypothetical protein
MKVNEPGISHRHLVALLAALLILALALAPRAEAFVYWTDGDIGRANLDGSGANDGFIAGARVGAVAVDAGHVYWTNVGFQAPDSIGRANLDGTAPNHNFISDVEIAGSGVAVDAGHVYWTNAGGIGRANLDGSGIDHSFIAGTQAGAVAVDGEHVYWSDFQTGTIGRANLDGSGVDHSFITGADRPLGLAVDGEHVYWTQLPGPIGRANLDGSGVDHSFIAAGCCSFGVAVDAGHVYWASSYLVTSPYHGAIARADLDGSDVDQCFIDAGLPFGVAVDALGPQPSDGGGAEACDSNEFSFGRVTKNKRKGTAKLTIEVVDGPGELVLAPTKKVKADDEAAGEGATEAKLAIKPRGKAKKRLNRSGKAKVKAEVTYTPDGGWPNTQSKKIKLVKR